MIIQDITRLTALLRMLIVIENMWGIMELKVLKNEEKRMNMVMFLFLAAIPVVAFVYVLLFNGGEQEMP